MVTRVKNERNEWVDGPPVQGEPYQYPNGFGGWVEVGAYYTPPYSLAEEIRTHRDSRIQSVQWMYERLAREERLNRVPTFTLEQLDLYIQELADLPSQEGFPENIQWPVLGQ